MELLSAIDFEDDIMTDVQKLDENTATIPESQPPNTEAATSSMEAANATEVAMRQAKAASSPYLNSNYHPSGLRPPPPTFPTEISLIFTFLITWQYCLGIVKPEKCLQVF